MTKKLEELRNLGTAELEERFLEHKTELGRERAMISSGTRAEKPAKIRNLRRNIARILTIMNEKKAKELKKGEK